MAGIPIRFSSELSLATPFPNVVLVLDSIIARPEGRNYPSPHFAGRHVVGATRKLPTKSNPRRRSGVGKECRWPIPSDGWVSTEGPPPITQAASGLASFWRACCYGMAAFDNKAGAVSWGAATNIGAGYQANSKPALAP